MYPGCWDMSAAGHVDAGEFGIGCVIRETVEEIGVTVTPCDIRYIGGVQSNVKTEKIWDRHVNEYYMVLADFDIEQVKPQPGEVDQAKWVDYAEYKNLVDNNDPTLRIIEAHRAFIRYFEKHGRD